jgi:hypothetical protein
VDNQEVEREQPGQENRMVPSGGDRALVPVDELVEEELGLRRGDGRESDVDRPVGDRSTTRLS